MARPVDAFRMWLKNTGLPREEMLKGYLLNLASNTPGGLFTAVKVGTIAETFDDMTANDVKSILSNLGCLPGVTRIGKNASAQGYKLPLSWSSSDGQVDRRIDGQVDRRIEGIENPTQGPVKDSTQGSEQDSGQGSLMNPAVVGERARASTFKPEGAVTQSSLVEKARALAKGNG